MKEEKRKKAETLFSDFKQLGRELLKQMFKLFVRQLIKDLAHRFLEDNAMMQFVETVIQMLEQLLR